jgi:hypothetical protein
MIATEKTEGSGPKNQPLQLLIQYSPQCTPKQPISDPHGATRQLQAIARAPAK